VDKPAHVLVVDDDEMMRDLVSSILEVEGYDVTRADSGAACLRAVAERRPDMLLVDLWMPGMNGWEVIEELAKDNTSPPLPVLAMSGMSTEQPPALKAVGRHVTGYLPKPFTTDQLLKACGLALEAARRSTVPVPGAERRRDHRRDLLLPATLLSREGLPAAVGEILNLSKGGAQLDLGAAFKPGTTLTLAFEIPGGHGAFRVSGRVKWRDAARLGLEFTEMSPADRQRLGELLDSPE
jgi:CheY-like chemotaxis protein